MTEQAKTTKTRFLNKDEELHLGMLIQAKLKAENELNSSKRITKAKREKLNETVKLGNSAVETLVHANLGLVYDRARVFKLRYPAGPEYEDLVQEGMAGLMTAVYKYDPVRGNKFSTMAYHWISQSVARGANKTGRMVRLPENRIGDYTKMLAISNSEEAQDMSADELDKHIMDTLNLSKKDLLNIRSAAVTHSSLNRTVGDGLGGSKELIEFVSEQHTIISSESSVIKKEMAEILLSAIEKLDRVKQEIILSVFYINDDEMMTPEQVRERHDIPPARFKRLQNEAIREMRTCLQNKGMTFSDFTEGS